MGTEFPYAGIFRLGRALLEMLAAGSYIVNLKNILTLLYGSALCVTTSSEVNLNYQDITSSRNWAGVRDIISVDDILLDSGSARTMLGPIVQYT